MRKKWIIFLAVSLCLTFLCLVLPCFYSDADVIGGADWPSYWLRLRKIGGGSLQVGVLLGFAAMVLSGFGLAFPSHMGGKTRLATLAISATGGLGLACSLWCISMSLGGRKAYPVALPLSVAGGVAALGVFCLLCWLYVHLRGRKMSWLGAALDVITSILFLPGFTIGWLWLLNALQEAF